MAAIKIIINKSVLLRKKHYLLSSTVHEDFAL